MPSKLKGIRWLVIGPNIKIVNAVSLIYMYCIYLSKLKFKKFYLDHKKIYICN